jgi:hypothetical protein
MLGSQSCFRANTEVLPTPRDLPYLVNTGPVKGSPIIALRQVLDRPELVRLGKPARFVFIEQRQDRLDNTFLSYGSSLPGSEWGPSQPRRR